MRSSSARGIFALVAVIFLGSAAGAQTPVGTAFTYQGRLSDGGTAAAGVYDFTFRLYDADVSGTQVGSTIERDDITVSAGAFTVTLDFGSVFSGSARWLEIGVRPGASTDSYTTLAPLQQLRPTPNALHSTNAANAVTVGGLSCADGQVVKWSGTVWTCGTDLDTNSGGTLTNVATGAGLTGGPISTTGTISIASGGVTSAMIANGAVGTAQIDPAQVQTRISGTCTAGSNVQSIAANGTVTCGPSTIPQGFTVSTLDSSGSVGQYTSITIGADGLGLISYFDSTNSDLKVAHCSNTACSSATTTTLDSTGVVGQYTSITIGVDGLGLISYFDSSNSDLKVAHCSNIACSSATTATLDSAGVVGQHTSITIGADGLGLISYFDQGNLDLKVAHCFDTACSTTTAATTLDSTGVVGLYTSITTGADGLGLVSYFDNSNFNLKVAHCTNIACSAVAATAVDSPGSVGLYTSITIGADGLGLVSYHDATNGDLKVAHCSNTLCSSATAATLDSPGSVGVYTSITIGADGLGLISYHDATNGDLKAAHCLNIGCSTASTAILDSTGVTGTYTSIMVGADGLGLISYWDDANGDLKAAHCSNAFCQPYVRRR